MNYLKFFGKLLLEGIVLAVLAGVTLVIVLHFWGDLIVEMLGG